MSKETPAAVDQAAIDAARAEGHASGLKAGAEAERTRISAILGSDAAKSRPAAARMLAFDTDKDSASAAASLAKLPEEKSEVAPAKSGAEQFREKVEAEAPGIKGGEQGEGPSRTERVAAMRGWKK